MSILSNAYIRRVDRFDNKCYNDVKILVYFLMKGE